MYSLKWQRIYGFRCWQYILEESKCGAEISVLKPVLDDWSDITEDVSLVHGRPIWFYFDTTIRIYCKNVTLVWQDGLPAVPTCQTTPNQMPNFWAAESLHQERMAKQNHSTLSPKGYFLKYVPRNCGWSVVFKFNNSWVVLMLQSGNRTVLWQRWKDWKISSGLSALKYDMRFTPNSKLGKMEKVIVFCPSPHCSKRVALKWNILS